ncbi:TPA: hypothetical protein DCW38_02530 [candidate division WOR-3 bacterium]|uniref:Thioredoxin domain-containing protein n=1 Tax=candidate division WOR-3 bacterium TaxID=2052148 RepID=A0A350H923_UNCW3|nr:hypothetical protein [candidate division WOR-3 bacterium]
MKINSKKLFKSIFFRGLRIVLIVVLFAGAVWGIYRYSSNKYGLDPTKLLKYAYGKGGVRPVDAGGIERIFKGDNKHFIAVGAEWCGPCIFSADKVISFKNKYKDTKFNYLDFDDSITCFALERHVGKIEAIPFYVVYLSKANIHLFIGSSDSNYAEIEKLLGGEK